MPATIGSKWLGALRSNALAYILGHMTHTYLREVQAEVWGEIERLGIRDEVLRLWRMRGERDTEVDMLAVEQCEWWRHGAPGMATVRP